MGRHKWRSPETALLVLPFLLLVPYALGLPLPLPAVFLPERAYLALSKASGAEELRSARGRSFEAFALLPDSLLPLPSASASLDEWKAIQDLLPDRPVLDALLGELGEGLPLLRRAALVTDFTPTSRELALLASATRKAGLPLSLRTGRPGGAGTEAPQGSLLKSFSWRGGDTGQLLSFELLLDQRAAAEGLALEARSRRDDGGGEILWSGGGQSLPRDLVLRLSTSRAGLAGIELSFEGPAGEERISLDPGSGSTVAPRVLVVSERRGQSTFIEGLYACDRVDIAEAAAKDLASYELVVLDGIPLAALGGRLSANLVEVTAKGLSSLLFVADTPGFGAPGDNPAIEALLPVSLLPRSLKDLPDMAVLILLDDSGSMFGGKLSLAKVAGLELLRGLKKGDRAGLLLFSDTRRWVWNFEEAGSIVAAPVLEPIEAEGGTELGPALAEGLERLAAVPMMEKHLVVISDGVTKPADFAQLARRAASLGVTISAMGVGEDLDRGLLERLAAQGGGRFYLVGSADQIPALIFEDRRSEARPSFRQGRIPILDLAGTRVATIGGMAQYSARDEASVLFVDEVGDPLFAGIERGNRATLLFASDLHGGYTGDFLSRPAVVAALRDRFDALFASRPTEVAVLEDSREARIVLRSDGLAAPSLHLSRAGETGRDLPFLRLGPEAWEASVVLPSYGPWNAALVDRGSSLGSFGLAVNEGIGGIDASSAAALRDWRAGAWRSGDTGAAWLVLAFLSALGATLVLRSRR